MQGRRRFLKLKGLAMDISIGDIITLKKNHPCGCAAFKVLRVGMDFKIKCEGCGHEVMAPRVKIEKNIKKIEKGTKDV